MIIIAVIAVVLIAAIAVAVVVSNNGNNDSKDSKHSGTVLFTVSSSYTRTCSVNMYIDNELVQSTTLDPMGYTSATKNVKWNDSSERHSVTVKVVYTVSGGTSKTQTKNITVADGQRQTVTITL